MCVHREPAYDREPWSCGDGGDGHGTGGCSRLRQSERAQDHAIILPLFHQFTGRDQTVVAEALRATCRRA
jgi:dTDP-4-amino-4,6-dideoxygalactose transaminase